MSQNNDFDERRVRKELSKLSKSQLIKKCKEEKVSISNSKKEMISTLIKKLEKKQKKKKNPLIKLIQKKKRKSKSGTKSDRSKLIKLFQTSDESEEFIIFVSNHTDKFVIAVIDIILDKSADSKDETDLSTMLFHEFRNDADLWLDLTHSIRKKLKSKLLNGISDLSINGGTHKIPILAHVIAIISTFEEWDELIPEITDLNSAIPAKLKILAMVSSWAPERLEIYSLQIAQKMYSEIVKIDDTNINSFESRSLFSVIDAVIKNIDNVALIIKIMKITLVFLLKSYVTNYETLKLFDSSLNINTNKTIFNELDCNMDESYDAAKTCFGLLCKLHFMYFDKIPLELRDELFFVLSVFTKICGFKIQNGFIQFPEEQRDWTHNEWDFAIVSQSIFSIFYEINEKHDLYDHFLKYFKEMNDNYNLIENIILNINYDIDEAVFSQWTHLLSKLSTRYVHYFWHKKDLFCPLLQQLHPTPTCQDLSELKQKLYNQEWFAVRWFVRNNYKRLYDQLRIPIMEIILKYLSKYVTINIIMKDHDHAFYDEFNGIWDDEIKVEYDVVTVNKDKFDPNTINYNVTNEILSKHKKECLIVGFIKALQSIDNINCYIVPKVINGLIHDFYPWIIESFDVYNESDFLLENEKTLITLTKTNVDRTIYGRINIGPKNRDIHEWKFKIHNGSQVSFGIDESECKMIDGGFLMPSPIRSHYSYASTGGKYNMDKNYKPYGDEFGVNDTITMILDCNLRTLRFFKNDIDQRINTEKIDLAKTFKMAICLFFSDQDFEKGITNCCVSLISYKCAIYNHNN